MDSILRNIHWQTVTPKQIQACLHSTNMLVSCVLAGIDASHFLDFLGTERGFTL